jgi:hypothetical protein
MTASMFYVRGILALTLVACGHAAEPVGESTYPVEKLTDPETCKDCHPRQYQDWSGSMHAYASDDPLFVALNRRGEKAQVGTFCVKCHAPMALHTGQTDGTSASIAALPKQVRGVTCYFCHNVDSVLGTHNNPLHLADDAVMRGEYVDAVNNEAHHSVYSTYLDRDRTESAAACGSCHDVVNRIDTDIERTYTEWQETVFSHPEVGTTCGQCHMPRSVNLEPIAEGSKVSGVLSRRTHSHQLPGVDLALSDWPEADAQRKAVQDFLDTELQTALCVRGLPGSPPNLMVIADNVAGGHKWPSGAAQDRRLWFEVAAYKAGTLIYQSGAVAPDKSPTDLTNDPDFWLVRDCMFDSAGQETHNFWEAAAYESNSLPGQLTINPGDPNYYKSHVFQNYPRGGDRLPDFPDRVTLKVQLEAFPRDLFEELFADPADLGFTNKDVDGFRDKLVRFTLGKELEWTMDAVNDTAHGGQTYYEMKVIPVNCVTNTAMIASADKVPATNHAMCKP